MDFFPEMAHVMLSAQSNLSPRYQQWLGTRDRPPLSMVSELVEAALPKLNMLLRPEVMSSKMPRLLELRF